MGRKRQKQIGRPDQTKIRPQRPTRPPNPADASRGEAELLVTFAGGGLFDSSVKDDISQVFSTMLFGENSPALQPERSLEPELIGKREESSVLFSLESLMNRAGGQDSSRLPKDPISGLIDIRRLVATSPIASRDVTDSVLQLGGIGFQPNHHGPVLAVQPQHTSVWVRISAIAGASLALVGMVVLAAFLLTKGEEPVEVSASPAERLAAMVDRVAALTPKTELQSASLLGIGNRREDRSAETGSEQSDVAVPVSKSQPDTKARRSRARSTTHRATAAKRETSLARSAGSSSEIDELLDGAIAKPAKERSKKKARRRSRKADKSSSGSKPLKLSRSQVKTGLGAVSRKVKRCGQGRVHGIISVEVVIKGNGRVAKVRPTGPFAGTSAGVCAARAVRRARFPEFTAPRMTVQYPFRF